MINVLICVPSLKNQGAERFTTELAIKLDRAFFNPIVLVAGVCDTNSNNYSLLRMSNIEIIDVSNMNVVKQTATIRRLLFKKQIDVIHSNLGSCFRLFIPNLLYKRVPHILTIHSMGNRIFSGRKKRLASFLFRTKQVIPVAICDTVKKSMVETYHLKDEDIELVYNGVDVTKHQYIERAADDTVRYISVGALYNIKNYSFLIDAFNILQQTCCNVKLDIIGTGEQKDQLQTKIEELGLRDKIKLLGNQDNVFDYLKKADVYCCSSLVEGLPLSVLEAMATGLPVVSSNAGGVVDIVKNELNGFIVELKIQEYVDALQKMTEYPIRLKYGIKSREIAESHSIEKMAVQYQQIYRKRLKL